MDKNIKEKLYNDVLLKSLLPILNKYDTYLVGGYVRDLFLNKQTNDRDIVVFNKPAIELAKEIQKATDGHFVELDAINRIYRVVASDKINYIDIAQGVGKNIEDDLKRRDFTVNAIAIDIKTLETIDITNGINDLKNKKINIIDEKNLFDDALRMVRAIRFIATLGFDIDKKIIDFVKKNRNLLENIAKERINYEIMKIFEGDFAKEAIFVLDEVGLVDVLFPEMVAVKTIPPNTHHHLPLFLHCVETMEQTKKRIDLYDEKIKKYFEQKNLGSHPRYAYLKLSAFLHDIGKPQTWTIEEETGRHRFIKHDEVGSNLVVSCLKNLKFSNKQIKYVQNLIKYHIYPSALAREEASEKTFNRYFRKTGEYALDIIFLAMGDRLSARGEAVSDEMVNNNLNHLNKMVDFYFENFINQKPLEKLLDGNEIMEILNIEKSPILGKIIKELKEAQINSEVITKKDAINFIKNIDYRKF